MTNKNLLFLVVIAVLLINIPYIGSVYAAYPKWSQSTFSSWTYLHSTEYKILLRTESLNYEWDYTRATLTLSSTFSVPLNDMITSFKNEIQLTNELSSKFYENIEYPCKISIDNRTINAYVKRINKYNRLILYHIDIARYLINCTAPRFYIEFPEQHIRLTFLSLGFKEAYDTMILHHTERGAHNRSLVKNATDRSIFIIACIIGVSILCIYIFLNISEKRSKNNYYSYNARNNNSTTNNSNNNEYNQSNNSKYGEANKSKGNNYNTNNSNNNSKQGDNKNNDYNNKYDQEKSNKDTEYNKDIANDIIDAFKFFDLSIDSQFDDVQKKRKFLLKAYHPDRYQNDKDGIIYAEQQMKKLNYYYELILLYYNNIKK